MSTGPNTPEEYEEEILQSLQNLSFEETATINEEDLNKNLELAQKKYVDEETQKCLKCSKIFNLTTATTSIHTHLQQQHNLLLEKEKSNLLIKKYSVEIQAEKTQPIFEWIILALKPFKVIEDKAFQNIIHKLDLFYQIPSHKIIKTLTSLKMESFMAITIHFIDENWNLQHFVLDIFHFKRSHTGKIIADKLYNLLEEFEIETKVIALTTDNSSNMISAANFLQDKLTDFCHYRCIAHILNLVVSAGLNLLDNSIKKLRKLIKMIRKSPKIFEDLKNIITLDDKPFLAPILDCKTRWNSTYQMVKRACLLYESIEMLLVKYSNLKTYMPNEEDWKIYKNLVDLLKQFYEATIELSSQTYPTIAHVQIILLSLRNDLESKKDINFSLHYVNDAMLYKYIEYFNLITESLHISAFLDSRYKKYCFPNMTDEEILIPIRQKINQQLPLSIIKPKKLSKADETIKLLNWWNTHTAEYPILSELAHNYLYIQASSVP
ncbi:4121_t:CDS:2, partial [Scutellospora calospora]